MVKSTAIHATLDFRRRIDLMQRRSAKGVEIIIV
jgi:hypothetical protein